MSSKGKGKEVVHSSGGGRCTACELLGRACEADCVFAPHFPAEDDPARFISVHAAFGARNVERFLRRVGPENLRAEAARYLVLNAPRRMAVLGAGGTQPPCAACLHLGDECAPECVFARHFPAGDDPERFAALDARFGAHDIAVFLCALSPEQQEDAVRNFVSLAQLPPPPPDQQVQEAERRPCAACQYLRRPCVPNCLFSTYFPPDDDPERFAAAHSAYGASNLDRRLRYLPPELRDAATATSVYEARRRQEDPVYGALGDVLLCELYLKMTREELAATRERLVPYVGREAAYRTFARKPRTRIPPATMQQVQDRMRGVAGLVMQQVAAEAAAGVTTFLTPLHEKLVMAHGNAPGSSGAAVPGPTDQPATDAAAKDPDLPEGGEDAGDNANEPSQAQDPGLQEGEEDAGDETSQGSAKRGKESAEGSSEA